MKKTYKKLMALTGAFGLFALAANAQISGVVTVNSAVTTGGTNYQSFTDLALALNTSGVNGPLTVNVVSGSGPYNEQPLFTQIAGVNASNRITINGNGNWLTFTSSNSAAPHTLGFNGTDYVSVNNLNVYAGGATYAMAVVLSNGANNNSFSACTFSCPLNGTNSYHVPFMISASMLYPTSGSNSGNYNTVTSCTMANGYYGVWNMGLTSAPYNIGNEFYSCRITDFYYYGMYFPYGLNMVVKNCQFDRMTRTASSSLYPMYGYYNQGMLLDGNKIFKMYAGHTTPPASSCYGMYIYGNQLNGPRNIVRNNIITEIYNTSTVYGIYCPYAGADVYNNTIDIDAPNNGTGTIYGMYVYGNVGQEMTVKQNLVTIRKPGSGSRYGFYVATTGPIVMDRNNVVHTPSIASSYYGYYNGAQSALSNWLTTNVDPNAMSVDPMYTNQATNDLHPTNVAMDNMGVGISGLVFDQEMAVRNQATPDVGALEFLSPTCSGAPGSNAVTSPTFAICPGENVTMGIAALTASTGLTYQWSSSAVSNVGPFTAIAGATSMFLTAPQVTANTWYQVVQTCTLPGGGSSSFVGTVNVSGPTSSVVPAYDGFEGIGLNNRLPNCSWMATGLGNQNKTYTASASGNRVPRTGTSFGAFDNASTGTSAYYTNEIAMSAGITYSAAIWWATEYFGYNNWNNLEILVGPNQSTTGLVQVASISPALSGPYKLLDGLFTVPTSGNYYVCIRATSSAGSAQYLMIDDLSITIPCTDGSGNNPTMIVSPASTVCAGTAVALNASGADSYLWLPSNQTGASVFETPMVAGMTNYTVVGTNTITGCAATSVIPVQVDASPNVFAVANPPIVCAGSPVIMTAYGAGAYVWSNGSNGQVVTINPTTSGSYTVIGTSANGCSGSFVQAITVNNLPNITVSSSNNGTACKDDVLQLQASGGVTYQWYSSSSNVVMQGGSINVQVPVTTVFTVVATGANGCVGKNNLTQNIEECTSIKEANKLSGVNVYPNPTSGLLTVEFNSSAAKSVSVQDLTGRVIMTANSTESNLNIDMSNLAAGVYYVKLQSEGAVNVVKVVKE